MLMKLMILSTMPGQKVRFRPRFTYLGDGETEKKYVHVIPDDDNAYLLALKGEFLAKFHFGSKSDADDEYRAEFTSEEIDEMRKMSDLAIDWSKVNYESA